MISAGICRAFRGVAGQGQGMPRSVESPVAGNGDREKKLGSHGEP